jgi:cellulose biosynthesis protein BcsQ
MHAYVFANQKGGVGKTTIALGVAAALGTRGTGVLLIDPDPQASATSSRGAGARTGDLLGAIQALVRSEFDLFAGNLPIAVDRYASRIYPQFEGDRRSLITRKARRDETRTKP